MTLTEWLRSALDEHERIARSALGPRWEARQIRGAHDPSVVFEDYVAIADPDRDIVVLSDVPSSVLPFVLASDPAHVLRTVQAHREILDAYAEAHEYYSRHTSAPAGEAHGLWTAVRSLAAIYRDTPGFDPSWIGES